MKDRENKTRSFQHQPFSHLHYIFNQNIISFDWAPIFEPTYQSTIDCAQWFWLQIPNKMKPDQNLNNFNRACGNWPNIELYQCFKAV